MKPIVVTGLWHLGCVTAASLSEYYHVVGHDDDARTIADLSDGVPPLYEPGLAELVSAGIAAGRLRFASDAAEIEKPEILWVAYDTPVDEQDRADTGVVARAIETWLPRLEPGALVIISSQVPVGLTARMEARAREVGADVSFAYLPENLRLGEALKIFRHPERVVAGVRSEADRARIAALLRPFSENVLWMSVESAEMAKHALNAFLATSVGFANEIATLCERVGADFKDVERALRSDVRIGTRAYLAAGLGFAGGTLARDLRALTDAAREHQVPTPLLNDVITGNAGRQRWAEETLRRELGDLKNKKIAVLGLVYKPGTDTLRRSQAVEMCRRLSDAGAGVVAFDPAILRLEAESSFIELAETAEGALADADAVLVATEWPEFRALSPASFQRMRRRLVVDPKRWLEEILASDPSIDYVGVGKATLTRGSAKQGTASPS